MRAPDLTIGPAEDPQTLRWHLLRWRGWQIALHRWCRSDGDRALHDHTGDNISILLTGRYREMVREYAPDIRPGSPWAAVFDRDAEGRYYIDREYLRRRFVPYFRKAETPHRVILHEGPLWSLWIRWPPRREWGFHCPKGWRHWRDFLAEKDHYNTVGHSTVGRGCD